MEGEEIIKTLPERTYTKDLTSQLSHRGEREHSRRTTRVIGENSAVRLIDWRDRMDMQRYKDIDRSLPEEIRNKNSTERELVNEIRKNRPGKEKKADALWIYGVVGSEGISEEEVGELQGMVNVYRDETVDKIKAKEFVPQDTPAENVLEVLFSKHPQAQEGQIASALRQVCLKLSRTSAETGSEKEIKPPFVITAYSVPENKESHNVLKAAGFKNKGRIELYSEEEGDITYDVFVLDWKKLNEAVQKNSHKELFKNRPVELSRRRAIKPKT